jgi:hypothetical protein
LNTLNMMDAGGLAQAIECLPSKQEALSSNPPTLSTVTKMCVYRERDIYKYMHVCVCVCVCVYH